jgi:hypothetical protein
MQRNVNSKHYSPCIADDQPKERVLKERETGGAYVVAALLRTFPLTGTVVLLILTRIEQIGLKVGSARV